MVLCRNACIVIHYLRVYALLMNAQEYRRYMQINMYVIFEHLKWSCHIVRNNGISIHEYCGISDTFSLALVRFDDGSPMESGDTR